MPAGRPNSALPLGQKFAILTRGQAFRSWNKEARKRNTCTDISEKYQMNWTATFVENVIEPLESTGNKLQLFVTDAPCKFNEKLVEQLGGSKRVAKTVYFDAEGQGDNFRKALNILNDEYGGVDNVAKEFDYVMVVRNDLEWDARLDDLQINYEKFNMFALSNKFNPNRGGWNVVLDTVHLMPARFYPAFDSSIGTIDCFRLPSGDGHPCYETFDKAIKNVSEDAEIGFMTPHRYRVRSGEAMEVRLPMPPTEPSIA